MEHYYHLDKLEPVIEKMKNGESVFIGTVGNSNVTICNEIYYRLWPEMLLAEIRAQYDKPYIFGSVLGTAAKPYQYILENRAALLDRYPADLFIVYVGKRANYSKANTTFLDDLEKTIQICLDKGRAVLAVTTIPMLEIDVDANLFTNVIWELPEHQEMNQSVLALLDRMEIPTVDLCGQWAEDHNAGRINSLDLFEKTDTAHPGLFGQKYITDVVKKAFLVNVQEREYRVGAVPKVAPADKKRNSTGKTVALG